jgi:hypothetical protein
VKFGGDTTDRDLGRKRIERALKEIDNSHVDIGHFGDKKAPDGEATLVGIAAVHEFGAPKAGIPERSFIRSTSDEERRNWQGILDRGLAKVLSGSASVLSVLFGLGEIGASAVRKKITDISEPPLADSTIERRGESANPLVDTGAMRAYARARVVIHGKVKKTTSEGSG